MKIKQVIIALCIIQLSIIALCKLQVSFHSKLPERFSVSFVVRDRLLKNQAVMEGTANVITDSWEDTEAVVRYLSEGDMEEERMLLYHHGNTMIKQGNHDHCVLDQDDIIPIHTILNSLKHMHQIDPSEVKIFDREVTQCVHRNNAVYSLNFAGQSYVVCVQAFGDVKPLKVIGHEFVVDILSFSPGRKIQWLTEQTEIATSCRKMQGRQTNPSVNFDLSSEDESWFSSYHHSCRFDWSQDHEHCDEHRKTMPLNALEPEKKVCIFLHGAGNTRHESGPPSNSFHSY